MSVLEFVEKYRKKLGLNVYDMAKGDKRPLGEWTKYQTEIYEGPVKGDNGLIVFCGKTSNNLVVIDLDDHELFDSFNDYIGKTFITKTGKKGYHLYFRTANEHKSQALTNNKGQNIDILGQGKIAVLPPSIHPETKRPYEIVSDNDILYMPTLEPIYQRLKELGFKPSESETKSGKELAKGGVIVGQIHDSLRKVALWYLFQTAPQFEQYDNFIRAWNQLNEQPEHEPKLTNDIKDFWNYYEKHPKENNEHDLSYLDYAYLVLNQCKFKTLKDTKEIRFYENGVYQKFGGDKIKEILLGINPQLRINAINEIIEKIKQLTPAKRTEFDKDEFEICLENGVLNVKTGIVSEHNPEKLFMNQLPVSYNPKAICPKFVKFMHTALPLPDDYIDQLEAFSTGLIQNTPKLEAMFFETGEGDNGKSTFFNIMNWFYGRENYSNVSIHEILENRFKIVRLEGKRINTFPDIKSDSLDNLGILKALVSGDEIDAENKYERSHSFVNYAKLFFSANELPEIKEKTFANFKRLRLTKWTQTFCKQAVYEMHKNNLRQKNPDLSDSELERELALNGIHKMNKQFVNSILDDENEKSGILNLLLIIIQHIIKRDGFFREYDINELKDQWSENSTAIEAFNNECLKKTTNGFVVKSEAHMVYYSYCKALGKPPKPDNVFHKTFKSMNPGIEEEQKRIGKKRKRVYMGFEWNFENDVVKKFRSRLSGTGGTGYSDNLTKHFESSGENKEDENKEDENKE